MDGLVKLKISLALPGLADGSLSAEPGGDNSAQKITVGNNKQCIIRLWLMP